MLMFLHYNKNYLFPNIYAFRHLYKAAIDITSFYSDSKKVERYFLDDLSTRRQFRFILKKVTI